MPSIRQAEATTRTTHIRARFVILAAVVVVLFMLEQLFVYFYVHLSVSQFTHNFSSVPND